MKLIKKDNEKGFTLIELVVVIAILAVLALILIPSITGYVNKANKAKNDANARSIYTAASVVRTEDDFKNPFTGTSDEANERFINKIKSEYDFQDVTFKIKKDGTDMKVEVLDGEKVIGSYPATN